MILTFHMSPLARGQGLYDIDRVWLRVTQKNFKIMESSNTVELRVFLSIFDETLTAHFLKTDDARTNRFLLLKQLTPKVHGDSISDDTTPSSGGSELIKFKLQTLSTFATVVRF